MALVTKSFSDIITFTRTGTNATYFNSAGVLTSAGANVPRFDYNPATLAAQGLLIEEQRQNLYTYSQTIQNGVGNWAIARSSTVANAAVGLDGTLTASKLQEDTTAANSHYLYAISTSYTSGTVYTQSVYVKAAGRTQIQMSFPSGAFTTELRVLYDLNAVTATVQTGTPTGTITAVGNGWYRCTITATATATAAANTIIVYLFNGTLAYNGDGTSGVFLWGAQLEAGAFPTSYIPTTTTALTRSADVASVNTLSPWWNASEGTFYVEGSAGSLANSPIFVMPHDGTSNNYLNSPLLTTAGLARLAGAVGGAAWTNVNTANSTTANTTFKSASAFKAGDQAICLNAGTVATGVNASVPVVTTVKLGDWRTSGNSINGYLRRITYYPRKLSSAELQAITA